MNQMPNPIKVYREDGGAWLVEVLSDEVDDEKFRNIEVRCLKQLQSSPLIGDIAVGEEWSACALQDCAYGGMWTLYDPQPDELLS